MCVFVYWLTLIQCLFVVIIKDLKNYLDFNGVLWMIFFCCLLSSSPHVKMALAFLMMMIDDNDDDDDGISFLNFFAVVVVVIENWIGSEPRSIYSIFSCVCV